MFENPQVAHKSPVTPRPRKRLIVASVATDVSTNRGASPSRSRKAGFKKSDVWRAISAAQKGGVTVSEMEIGHDGAIKLKFASDHSDSAEPAGNDQFDQWADRL
ncbi:MAG: hypothetical protein U1D66_03710 [Erythrobacter sp.]|nr:hypothetical protein [Erythrobacter sp.]